MIKGQNITDLLVIKDNNRSGTLFMVYLLVILITLYILYNLALLVWSNLKISKLESFTKEIKKEKGTRENHKEEPPVQKTKRVSNDVMRKKDSTDDEDMEVYNSLRNKKRW